MPEITQHCRQISCAIRMTGITVDVSGQISQESAGQRCVVSDSGFMFTNTRYGWWVAGCSSIIEMKAREVEAVTQTLRREGLNASKFSRLLTHHLHRETDRQLKQMLMQCRYPFGAIDAITAFLIQREKEGRVNDEIEFFLCQIILLIVQHDIELKNLTPRNHIEREMLGSLDGLHDAFDRTQKTQDQIMATADEMLRETSSERFAA